MKKKSPLISAAYFLVLLLAGLALPAKASATTWFSIVDDNFNRSNTSVAGTASSTSGVGNGWIDTNGSIWNISSNQLQGSSNLSSDYVTKFLLRPSSENTTNQRIIATIPANENISGQFLGLVLRWQSPTLNYYLAHLGTNGIFIYKIVGGATTLVASKSLVLSTADSYQLEFAATSTNPTNIYLAATDLTSSTLAGSISTTDNDASLQSSGSYGFTTWYNSGVHLIHASRAQTFSDISPDTTPPVISSIAVTATTASGATVGWSTDEVASTKMVYSTDTSYSLSTSETDTAPRALSHSVSVSSLVSCTTYNFKAVSADAAGNYATSTANTLTTTGCPVSVPTTQVSVVSGAILPGYCARNPLPGEAFVHILGCNSASSSPLVSVPTATPTPAFPTSAPLLFTHDLSLGSIDTDVLRLQKYLNTHGFILTSKGGGSPGEETNTFGTLTYNALAKYQIANAAAILGPLGLLRGTGYFGSSTRATLNRGLISR